MADPTRSPAVDAVASAAAQNGAAAGIAAARQYPHTRSFRQLWAAVVILGVFTALALGGYVANRSANNATVACQGQLQQNQDAQNVAGVDSRLLLRKAGQQTADSETAKAADIATMLDPAASPEVRKAAAADYGRQSTLMAQAWQEYVNESAKADQVRAENPTTFRC